MNKKLFLLFLFLTSSAAQSLEPWQGHDVPADSWRCGAPLVRQLRRNDPSRLLNDPTGRIKLKRSLELISESNLSNSKSKLGYLTFDEKKLINLIETKFHTPIVHRTSMKVAKLILKSGYPLSSPIKRNVPATITPGIEQKLFAGWDCIFAAAGPPYGISKYGTVILSLKEKSNFSWGSIYTGFSWTKEVERRSITASVTGAMKQNFARQIYTNNHYDTAMAYQIISHIRAGSTLRGLGRRYDKRSILKNLLRIANADDFWSRVSRHRLGFLEAHYTDNVSLNDVEFIQFRSSDMDIVRSWRLSGRWLGHGAWDQNHTFIQSFDRQF